MDKVLVFDGGPIYPCQETEQEEPGVVCSLIAAFIIYASGKLFAKALCLRLYKNI